MLRPGAVSRAEWEKFHSKFVTVGPFRLYQKMFHGCAHDPRRWRWSIAVRKYSGRVWVYTPFGAFFFEKQQ